MPGKVFLLLLCVVCLVPGISLAVEVGDKMPLFQAQDMDGKTVDLEKLLEKGPVMIVFWASWCPNCKTEVPKVNEMAKVYGNEGMTFIGINVGYNDSVARAKSFMEKTGINYPVIFDKESALTSRYQIFGVPTIVLADRHGIIRFKNYRVPEMTTAEFQELKN